MSVMNLEYHQSGTGYGVAITVGSIQTCSMYGLVFFLFGLGSKGSV